MGCGTSVSTFDELKKLIFDDNKFLNARFEFYQFSKAHLVHREINKTQEIQIINSIIAYDRDAHLHIALELKFPDIEKPVLFDARKSRVGQYIVGTVSRSRIKINGRYRNAVLRLRIREEQSDKTYKNIPPRLELDVFGWCEDSQWNNGYSSIILSDDDKTNEIKVPE